MLVLIEIQLSVVSAKYKEVIAPFVEVRNLMELEEQTGWEEADRLREYNRTHLNPLAILWISKTMSRGKLADDFREG